MRKNNFSCKPYLNRFFSSYSLLLIFLGLMAGCAAHSNLTPIGEGNVDAAIGLWWPIYSSGRN